MLAKKTVKNQLTLPKVIADRFPGVDYFEVETSDDAIVLRPANVASAGAVRAKLKQLGITQSDVDAAIVWARKSR